MTTADPDTPSRLIRRIVTDWLKQRGLLSLVALLLGLVLPHTPVQAQALTCAGVVKSVGVSGELEVYIERKGVGISFRSGVPPERFAPFASAALTAYQSGQPVLIAYFVNNGTSELQAIYTGKYSFDDNCPVADKAAADAARSLRPRRAPRR